MTLQRSTFSHDSNYKLEERTKRPHEPQCNHLMIFLLSTRFESIIETKQLKKFAGKLRKENLTSNLFYELVCFVFFFIPDAAF